METRYISLDDAVQCANDLAEDFAGEGLDAASHGAQAVAEWLKDIPAAAVVEKTEWDKLMFLVDAANNVLESAPKWIPVKESLPHAIAGESDDVLTLNRFGEYNILYFDGNKWRKRNGEQYTLNPLFEVVYWMLPGAPDGFRPWRGT